MTIRTIERSPQVYARIGGILYLMIIVAGAFGEIFVRGTLIVSGNAAATASNIMASQPLWRAGIAGDILVHVFDIPLMLILYLILKPASKNLALLAVLFNLIQTAVLVANKFNLLMPLFSLGNADYLNSFAPDQLHALTQVFVRVHGYGFGIGLIFFGFACLVYGILIFKSGYLPGILGIFMQIAGLSYLTNSFALLLAPKLASMMFPAILVPALVGELSLALWLLMKGVNIEKWNRLVRTS